MNSEVEAWLKRTSKKGPFKLYSYNTSVPDVTKYTVIFKDKGKVKIGTVHDGQWCRYGIRTFGALSGPTALGLWQSGAGAVDEYQLEAMIRVWNDECHLSPFLMESLKGLKH